MSLELGVHLHSASTWLASSYIRGNNFIKSIHSSWMMESIARVVLLVVVSLAFTETGRFVYCYYCMLLLNYDSNLPEYKSGNNFCDIINGGCFVAHVHTRQTHLCMHTYSRKHTQHIHTQINTHTINQSLTQTIKQTNKQILTMFVQMS